MGSGYVEKSVYSYHTFYFPFRWNEDDLKRIGVSFYELFENLNGESEWKRKIVDDRQPGNHAFSEENLGGFKDYFDRYQYFEESAREFTCFSKDGNLVKRYYLNLEEYPQLQYEITVDDKVFSLDVDEVELIVYSTDVAILGLKTSYHPTNERDRCSGNVKLINEFGRRVGLSFWPDPESDIKKYPDQLRLVYQESKVLVADCLSDFVTIINHRDMNLGEVRFMYVTKLLRRLLGLCNYKVPKNLKNKSDKNVVFRAKKTNAENEILIHPILNEKMYVTCCVVDYDYAHRLSDSFDEDEEHFEEAESRSFSELLTVDLEDNPFYKSKTARDNYIREHTYYLDIKEKCPIVSGVTDQIYVQVMAEHNYATAYHRNIYNEIILLGLIQKMSIAEFQTEITLASKEIIERKKKMNANYVMQIIDLQKRYVGFQNQYLLHEITSRSEGKDLYRRIQREMGVQEENAALTEIMSNIYSLVDAHQGFSFNKGALVISVIALFTSLIGTISSAYTFNEINFGDPAGSLALLIDVVAIGVSLYVILVMKYKRQ